MALSKHLCGCATDLALRCLANSGLPVNGLSIACCCHHRCEWNSYVAKSFITDDCGFNAEDFFYLTRDVFNCLYAELLRFPRRGTDESHAKAKPFFSQYQHESWLEGCVRPLLHLMKSYFVSPTRAKLSKLPRFRRQRKYLWLKFEFGLNRQNLLYIY